MSLIAVTAFLKRTSRNEWAEAEGKRPGLYWLVIGNSDITTYSREPAR